MITITASVVTLGCRLNQADSALLSDRLRKAGFEIVGEDHEDSPSLIVINSCAVTATATRKTRQLLAALRRKHPYAYIVLTGCAALIDSGEAADNSDYDLLLPSAEKDKLESLLERRFNISPDKGPHNTLSEDGKIFREGACSLYPFKTRANLKVQEGCENFCSYCIVPQMRGPERSRDFEETLADFRQLVEKDFREIIISGVNICSYKDGKRDITDLLKEMLKVPGDFRIRLSSTEPGPMIPAIVDLIAENERLCHFLHLPVQSGCDKTLKAMNRHYTCSEYRSLVEYARSKVPDIHIGSDWIVGFPGETAKDFEETCNFIRSMEYSNLHVFPFSPRKGTVAATMDGRISVEEMMERLEKSKVIKNEAIDKFSHSLIGHEERLLVERQCSETAFEGLSSNFARIRFRTKDNVIGNFVRVQVVSVTEEGVIGARRIAD